MPAKNHRGLAALSMLAGVAIGAVVGAGATLWLGMRNLSYPAASVAQHIHDDVANTVQSDVSNTHGEWVKYANAKGDSVRAYVAYPETSGKAPAIIVIHEIFGLTKWEPTVADSFAKKGYIAITPDLLSSRFGMSPPSEDSGRRLVPQLKQADVNADLDATYSYLSKLPSANADRIGIIGFCWGGGNVWNYTSTNPKLKAAVACYGPLADTVLLKSINTPVRGVYGQNDSRVTASLPNIVRIMAALKKPFVADSYLGTGHGFLKTGATPPRTGAGTPEAARAQKDIDEFFAKYLKGP